MVPPGAPRRDHHLPRHADHVSHDLEDPSDAWPRHEPQRRLRHGARVVSSPLQTALETTQGQIDGFSSQLPFKCYLPEVASVGD